MKTRYSLAVLVLLATFSTHSIAQSQPVTNDWKAAGWPEHLIPSIDLSKHWPDQYDPAQCVLLGEMIDVLTKQAASENPQSSRPLEVRVEDLAFVPDISIRTFSDATLGALRRFAKTCAFKSSKQWQTLWYAHVLSSLIETEQRQRFTDQFDAERVSHEQLSEEWKQSYSALQKYVTAMEEYVAVLERDVATLRTSSTPPPRTDWAAILAGVNSSLAEMRKGWDRQATERQLRWQNYHLWVIGDELGKLNRPRP